MTIELFIDYISQPSRAVLAFCIINKIPVAIREIRIAKMDHLKEQYANLNPMRKVPAIKDTENGLIIGQSHAIMAYLSRKFNLHKLFQPSKTIEGELVQAKVEEYLHYHHANTRKCALLLYAALFSKLYPVQHGTVPDEKAARRQVEDILTFINEHYFKESSYMIGKTLTAADLAAYFEIITLQLLTFPFSQWKNIHQWMQVIKEIPAVKQANMNYQKMVPKMRKLKASL